MPAFLLARCTFLHGGHGYVSDAGVEQYVRENPQHFAGTEVSAGAALVGA